MRSKRVLSAILTAALALSLLVLPASAAPGSFTDVTDPTTALNVDILRLMGIVSGVGGGRFDPNGHLTRAQFCTMAVGFLQKRSEAARYATRTIFSDVNSTHWARSYINFAASCRAGGGASEEGTSSAGSMLVSGVGNGRFLPDNDITLAEAATILLRALGYSDQQAGAVWPQGYLDLAGSVGLLDGLPASARTVISRAQAAQLFVNALKCKKADGELYYKSLGTLADAANKTIILAVNVETDDGRSTGAIRTSSNESSEAYLPAQGDGNVPALQGRRGDLVLNERGDQIVAFIPDDSTAITITLAGDAQAAYVKSTGGRQYTISGDTKVFTSAGKDSTPYLQARSGLVSGTQITMYSEKGKITAIYATSSATSASTDAVVVLGGATAATFHQLTGGAENFKIVKGRQTIGLSDIKEYDVVTYDQLTNTLMVSDLRLSCVYMDAAPNAKTPTTIKITDKQELTVLESAWATIGDFKIGETVTLLLTADGKVAGMAPTNKARSNAIGFVDGKNVELYLPNGLPKKLEDAPYNTSIDNQLVSISYSRDRLNISRMSSRSAPGAFQVNGMSLGSYTVTAGARIYEQVRGGAMVPIDRSSLSMASIPESQIAAYHLNTSNMVDFIVINDVTGDAYQYGMMESHSVPVSGTDDADKDKYTTTWKLIRGSGDDIEFVDSVSYSGRSGDMVGVVPGKPKGDGDGSTILSLIKLTEIKNVKPSAFFDSQGVPHVTVNGRTYQVDNDVECCHSNGSSRATDVTWFTQKTGTERLSAARAWSDDLTLYVDPVGQKVRVIKAN